MCGVFLLVLSVIGFIVLLCNSNIKIGGFTINSTSLGAIFSVIVIVAVFVGMNIALYYEWNDDKSGIGLFSALGLFADIFIVSAIFKLLVAAVDPRPTKTIDDERREAELSQLSNTPREKKYFTSPCPYCGHYKVRYSTWDDKKMSVAFWGVWSSKVGKNYHCDNCKRDFNNNIMRI